MTQTRRRSEPHNGKDYQVEISPEKAGKWYLAKQLCAANYNGMYTMAYDPPSRMTCEQAQFGQAFTIAYDPDGKRTVVPDSFGGVARLVYDGANRLTTRVFGGTNQTTLRMDRMLWAKDEPTDGGSATLIATYIYDVLGNRLEKDVWTSSGGTVISRFGYDIAEPPALAGGLANAWADLNGSNQLLTRYLEGDQAGPPLARISAAGVAGWYLADHMGSVRSLTDNTGTLIDTISYDAYGKIKSESSPSNGDRFKWADLQYDSNIGLNFAKARPEDPSNGRWLEQDPLGFSAGDLNLYRYVRNELTSRVDPYGLAPQPEPEPIPGPVPASSYLNLNVAGLGIHLDMGDASLFFPNGAVALKISLMELDTKTFAVVPLKPKAALPKNAKKNAQKQLDKINSYLPLVVVDMYWSQLASPIAWNIPILTKPRIVTGNATVKAWLPYPLPPIGALAIPGVPAFLGLKVGEPTMLIITKAKIKYQIAFISFGISLPPGLKEMLITPIYIGKPVWDIIMGRGK